MNRNARIKNILLLFLSLLAFAGCRHQNKPITSDGNHYIRIDSTIGFSAQIEKTITPYREKIQKQMNRVIGYSDTDLTKGRPESLLTNFAGDIILKQGIKIAKEKGLPVPVMSVVNTKGLRSPIKKGPITVENIFRLMPFENKLVIMKLNGKEMQQLFDHMADFGGEAMSGATFGIKDDKPVNIKIGGKPFRKNRTYTIVVPDYISHGGDRYYMLKNVKERYDTEVLIRDAIIRGIEELTTQNKHITSTLDKRVYHVD
jgi:2',3'-cyclic-nucleotide 2'-phosphodiesterase (5'-nucleotidase family)